MNLFFASCFYQDHISDPCFQNKNSGCRLTGRMVNSERELDIKIWKHESQTKLLKNTNEMWAAFICCSERWPLEEKWTPDNDIIRISCQKHSVLTLAILNPIPFRFSMDFNPPPKIVGITTYRKVPSSSLSRLVAHFQIFRRLMKEKFDACVTFGQKVPKLIPAFRDFTIRDPHYFVILKKKIQNFFLKYFLYL